MLGKTVQVIAFFCCLHERFANSGPHIVVMPLSVISSWTNDIKRFAPDINTYVHHGEKDTRINTLEKWIRKRNRNVSSVNNTTDDSIEDDNNSRSKIHIVITTYELAIKDMHVLSKLRRCGTSWQYLVVCPRM